MKGKLLLFAFLSLVISQCFATPCRCYIGQHPGQCNRCVEPFCVRGPGPTGSTGSTGPSKKNENSVPNAPKKDSEAVKSWKKVWDMNSHQIRVDDNVKRDERSRANYRGNLIYNGNFESNDFNPSNAPGIDQWTQWSEGSSSLDFWAITRGTSFYSENNLPPPPEGNNAAMTATPDGSTQVGLYQDFPVPTLQNCPTLQYRLKFKYFYRSYSSLGFLSGHLTQSPPPIHMFTVDILHPVMGLTVQNMFVTRMGDLNTTGEYKQFEGSFYYANAINAEHSDSLRLRFGVRSDFGDRLRVGIDDVHLAVGCLNAHSGYGNERPTQQTQQNNDDDDK